MNQLQKFVFSVFVSMVLFVVHIDMVSAQYQWRNKDGTIEYSDKPPPLDVPESKIIGSPIKEKKTKITMQPKKQVRVYNPIFATLQLLQVPAR